MSKHFTHSGQFIFAAYTIISLGCSHQSEQPPTDDNTLPMPSSQGLTKVALLPTPYNSGNAINGRVAFLECANCHTLERGGNETNGPNLHGVFQRRAAIGTHYPYSEALRNSNIEWDVRHLDHWLFNPHEALPGTSMAYIGVRNDAKRRDILAYLIATSSNHDGE